MVHSLSIPVHYVKLVNFRRHSLKQLSLVLTFLTASITSKLTFVVEGITIFS